MSLYVQWTTVLLMMLSGLALGIVFDGYRVVAGQFRFPRWTVPLLDLMYWLAATLFVFQMLVKGNQGELRFYVFLGLAAGAWLYVILLSKVTVAIVTWLVRAILAIFRFINRCLYVLIVLPLKGLWIFTKGLGAFLLSAAMFIGKIVLQCVKPLWWLVRWIFRPLILPIWERLGMTERLHRNKQKVFSGMRRMNQWVGAGRAKAARLLRLFHHKK
ncbi:spore cortex biosynthesis protein YabQ [Paenibacillus thiaminolyticus]|uniref:spore cortex biosynthesis protein YabQ n=1 Tax=Paenibacillus thiaminolyticus TaxID=49283 RepID=UPI003D281813